MPRRQDIVRVETDAGVFDGFQELEIVNDILGITEAAFVIGDDGAWPKLEKLLAPGQPFKVTLNGRLRLTGRAEVNTVPMRVDGGVTIQLIVRSKLSDARMRSADPSISVTNTTIKKFILDCYKPLGYTEKDFVFGEFVDVELMTGKGAGGRADVDLAPFTVQQAMIQPPETIWDAAARHLDRYRALQWDAPDGRIVVGRPAADLRPLARLLAKLGPASKGNNICELERIKDWTDVPRTVRVHGQTWGKDVTKSQFKGEATDADVDAVAAKTGHFDRLVLIHNQQSKEKEAAQRAAQRELANRIRRKDAWLFTMDGWSYWNGREQIPWATNMTADIDVDPLGGAHGKYLITRTRLRLDLESAATSQLEAVHPSVWAL